MYAVARYLEQNGNPDIAKLLNEVGCIISPTSYSGLRWNALSTTVTLIFPQEGLANLNDYVKAKIEGAMDAVYPKEAGHDITNIEFSVRLERPPSVGSPTASLRVILSDLKLESLNKEFDRALNSIDSDHPAALTAACSILESVLKIYIETHGLILPKDQTLKPLWNTVAKDLNLQPNSTFDNDINSILTGFRAVIEGIATLRTHAGSAHGRGLKSYRVEGRHARLALHASHTLATFLIETINARKNGFGQRKAV